LFYSVLINSVVRGSLASAAAPQSQASGCVNYSSKCTSENQSAFPGTLCNKKGFTAAAELLHRKLEKWSQELSLLNMIEEILYKQRQIQTYGFGPPQHMV